MSSADGLKSKQTNQRLLDGPSQLWGHFTCDGPVVKVGGKYNNKMKMMILFYGRGCFNRVGGIVIQVIKKSQIGESHNWDNDHHN